MGMVMLIAAMWRGLPRQGPPATCGGGGVDSPVDWDAGPALRGRPPPTACLTAVLIIGSWAQERHKDPALLSKGRLQVPLLRTEAACARAAKRRNAAHIHAARPTPPLCGEVVAARSERGRLRAAPHDSDAVTLGTHLGGAGTGTPPFNPKGRLRVPHLGHRHYRHEVTQLGGSAGQRQGTPQQRLPSATTPTRTPRPTAGSGSTSGTPHGSHEPIPAPSAEAPAEYWE